MADGSYKCHDCHMTFGSLNLLQKHKQKFCVGGSVGDPDSLRLRKGLWSADDPPPRPYTPEERPLSGGEKLEAKDYQRYNPNQEAQLKQLAENHGRQMEYLQLRNRDLEKQKEDIQKRLSELGNKGRPTGGEDSGQLLAELRAQEERNQRALEDLKRQLYDINHQRVNIIEVDKGHPLPPPPPPPQPETGRKSYVYPIYYGNSMVAEISAIRQAYLQNGGNDPDILQQMAQMQAEAQNIEDQMKRAGYDNRHREKKDTTQITQLELENERLHRELMLLQEQNILARERKKTEREGRNLKRYHSFNQHDAGHWEHDKLEQFVQKYETVGNAMFHKNSPHTYPRDDREIKRKYRDKKLEFPDKPVKYSTHAKPQVPPLDLRGITDSLDSVRKDQQRPQPRWMEQTSKPSFSKSTELSKLDLNPNFTRAYDRKYGRDYPHNETMSLYNPRPRNQSGSHKSVRTEILDGVIEPRRRQKFHMQKGLSDNDLYELFRQTKDSKGVSLPGRDRNVTTYNTRTMYNVPADRKYETISLQQREEMNPRTQNIISTVTYKQEKIKEKAKV